MSKAASYSIVWLRSEVQPLETRSAGQSITTLVNLMFSFVIGQASHALNPPLKLWLSSPSVRCGVQSQVLRETKMSCAVLPCNLPCPQSPEFHRWLRLHYDSAAKPQVYTMLSM